MLRNKLILLATLALLSLIATGWISHGTTRVMARWVAALDHTRDVLLVIDQFRGQLAEAEAYSRGYVITGAASLRNEFERAAPASHDSVERLRALAALDSSEQQKVARLHDLLERRTRLLTVLIVLKEGRAAQSAIDSNIFQGMEVSSEIAGLLEDIRAEELRRFRQQTAAAKSARQYATYAPGIMAVIATMMFALLLAQVMATLKGERMAREDLRRLAVHEHEARERAQEADQLKDQFLATVSHELRTPLTAIIGWCGMLQNTRSRQELLEEGLANIGEAARMQSHLVEDLLDVSRIVAGKLKLCVSEVSLPEVIEHAIASVAPSAQAKGIVIRKHLDTGTPVLQGDPTRLQQVIWNLLSNSIKFTPPGGTVDVRVRSKNSRIEISVSDTGEGIAPDLLPHIFDYFRQGRSGGAREGGLGLGLSIVKNLVELHGGSVRAESDGPGKGAKFTVRLPAAAKTTELSGAATAPPRTDLIPLAPP